jgi:formylglycine-generating enzyme
VSDCCGPASELRDGGAAAAHEAAARTSAHSCARPAPASAAEATATAARWCEIPAGTFTMGSDDADAIAGDGEGPARRAAVDAFRIGAATVTNAEFAAFVRATRHVTDAERFGRSFVFFLQLPAAQRERARAAVAELPWWLPVEDACWQRPEGAGSHVRDRARHPVVHVSWRDATAYCEWAGVRLPSETEWERAARGGLEGRRFAWGDELFDAAGVPRCNVFRGTFPNAPAPGWLPGPIDAQAGAPNSFGLFNVCGNVWEWCADAREGGQRALRGGSFLCHDSYCNRYRVAARSANTADTSASHIGFRVVA